MEVVAATLCSGSSGNSALISDGETHLLVDCGLSLRRLSQGLAAFGLDIRSLSGVLLTHEHSDHIAALKYWGGFDVPVYSSQGTLSEVISRKGLNPKLTRALPDGELCIGRIKVNNFHTSHDAADSRGFTFDLGCARVGICTDLGEMTEDIISALTGCDYIIIECNHDVHMLKNGSYPLYLRRRILSRFGHLCNEDCARAVVELVKTGTGRVTLAHLSEENNDPSLALGAVIGALCENGLSDAITVDAAPRFHAGQPYRGSLYA